LWRGLDAALVEDFLGETCRSNARGPAGVERDVRDQLGYLVASHAVVQRPADVALELLDTPLVRQDGNGDQAAVTLGQLGTFPDVPEQHLLAQLSQLGHCLVWVAAWLCGHWSSRACSDPLRSRVPGDAGRDAT